MLMNFHFNIILQALECIHSVVLLSVLLERFLNTMYPLKLLVSYEYLINLKVYFLFLHGYIELQHEVSISSSSSGTVEAGGVLILTCNSVSNKPHILSWMGPNGLVTSGDGITVQLEEESDTVLQSSLIFSPLRTSHAGNYSCISNVEEGFSIKEVISFLGIQSESQLLHDFCWQNF